VWTENPYLETDTVFGVEKSSCQANSSAREREPNRISSLPIGSPTLSQIGNIASGVFAPVLDTAQDFSVPWLFTGQLTLSLGQLTRFSNESDTV